MFSLDKVFLLPIITRECGRGLSNETVLLFGPELLIMRATTIVNIQDHFQTLKSKLAGMESLKKETRAMTTDAGTAGNSAAPSSHPPHQHQSIAVQAAPSDS